MKRIKTFMLLFATMAMVLPFSSCSKDDEDDNKGGDDEKWEFKNGISELKDDGKTISFAINDPSVALMMLDLDWEELGPVAQSVQTAIQQVVFKFGYDKDEVVTSANIAFSCTSESTAKTLLGLLKEMDSSESDMMSVKGSKVIISGEGEDIEMTKSEVVEMYYYMYAVLNNDGSKASISEISYNAVEYIWTITTGGITKAMGVVSITKHYLADDGMDDPIEYYIENILCKDEASAQLIAKMNFEEEDAPYELFVDGSEIVINYSQSFVKYLTVSDMYEDYESDKKYLESYE